MLYVVNRVPRRICVPKRAEEYYVKNYIMRRLAASKLVVFVKHYYGKEITQFGRRT